MYRENQLVHRDRCYECREGKTEPTTDGRAIARLRRSWSSVDTLRLQPLPRADLRDDDRVEHLREHQEAAEPWRSDVPLYDPQIAGENALLATLALNFPELASAA